MSARASRGTVTIAVERCKGCELCIPACPPRVLQMSQARNGLGVPYPELLPGCTGSITDASVCRPSLTTTMPARRSPCVASSTAEIVDATSDRRPSGVNFVSADCSFGRSATELTRPSGDAVFSKVQTRTR